MVSEAWIKYKLEKWFNRQCNSNFYNRLKLTKPSQTCTLKRQGSFRIKSNCPLLTESNRIVPDNKRILSGTPSITTYCLVHKVPKNLCECKREAEPSGKRKSFRLSFKKNKKSEDVKKPVLPEVLKTYDKGVILSSFKMSSKLNIDLTDLERSQRNLLFELELKRSQVQELKNELEEAKIKIYELQGTLASTKSANEESQYNLNLAIKNAKHFENQLQTNNELALKHRLHKDLDAIEKDSRKELLQKTELENFHLQQELNELRTQRSCDAAYQKELSDQYSSLQTTLAHITDSVQKFQPTTNQINDLLATSQEITNKLHSFEYYQEEFHRLKQRYCELEEKCIFKTAALAQIENLSNDSNFIQFKENLQEIMKQRWSKCVEFYAEQKEKDTESIKNLLDELCQKKDLIATVCVQLNDQEVKMQELSKEEVKPEIFEIPDDL